METYGVSFDGFEPSCGRALYRCIENERLPELRAEVERWRRRRDALTDERATLKAFKADLEGLARFRKGLVDKLQTKIVGDVDMPNGEATMNDIMPLGVEDYEVKARASWTELSAWLDEAKSPIEQIELFCKYARERINCGLKLFENAFESSTTDIRFWERTLELQRAYWVFEKADRKYKTKICREIAKMLGDYIGDCRGQLSRYNEETRVANPLYEDIKWLYDRAQEDLARYRQIKADISGGNVGENVYHGLH